MERWKWMAGLTVVLAGWGGATYFGRTTSTRLQGSTDPGRELEALRAELESLRTESAENTARALMVARGAGERSGQVEGRLREEGSAAGEPEEALAVEEAAPEPLDQSEVVARIDGVFDTEAWDPGWSASATREATAALTDGLPGGSSLGKIECRTSLCRVESSHPDLDEYHEFVDASFMSRERKLWNGGFLTAVVDQTSSSVTAVSYVAKEGQPVVLPGLDGPPR